MSFLFQREESLRSFASERFEFEIQSPGRIHTEGTGYGCLGLLWVVRILGDAFVSDSSG